MNDLGKVIAECWRQRRVTPGPACSDDKIAQFERRLSIELPADVRTFLKYANGMESEHDSEGFYIWPIEAWGRASVQLSEMKKRIFDGADQMVLFADYLQWSWAYGLWVRPDPDYGSVWIICGNRERRIAADFDSFLRAYVGDDSSLYNCK